VDRSKFKDLFEAYAKKVYNYTLWLVRDKEASDDIVQSVFIKLWNKTWQPKDDKEIVWWLYMVARNECMDFFRKQSRFARFQNVFDRESQASSTPEEVVERKFIWQKLGTLGEQDRTIIYLHIREGYSYKEIAENMSMTENAVRVKAFRALARLRKEFVEEPV
jgi:RNA polymerase sigma-70 factor (ECF subfamily)